jgi:hypothetical protein
MLSAPEPIWLKGGGKMWSLVAFAGLVVALGGIIGIIRPIPALFLPTRGRAALTLFLGFVVLAIGAVQDQPADSKPQASTASEPSTPIALPTATSQPTSPQDRVRDAVQKALGPSNRKGAPPLEVVLDGSANVSITFPISENLTEGMTKRGAQMDVVKILRAINSSGVDYNAIDVHGTFSMVDRFGNATEQPVVTARYLHQTVNRINFNNFLTENIYKIADGQRLHPAFTP